LDAAVRSPFFVLGIFTATVAVGSFAAIAAAPKNAEGWDMLVRSMIERGGVASEPEMN
jgi:hypothetical protein